MNKIRLVLLIGFILFIIITQFSLLNCVSSNNAELEFKHAEELKGKDAIEFYRDIIKRFPQEQKWCARAQLKIGLVYCWQLADGNNARDELEKVIKFYPDQKNETGQASYWIARILQTKDPKKAVKYYHNALKNISPQSKLYELARVALAYNYTIMEDFEAAINLSREIYHEIYATTGVPPWLIKKDDRNLKKFYEDFKNLKNVNEIVEAYKNVLSEHKDYEVECFAALYRTASSYQKHLRSKKEEQEFESMSKIYTTDEEIAGFDKAKADIEANLSLALNLYELDTGTYPTTLQGLSALIEKPTIEPAPTNWNGPYIKMSDFIDPWGNEYIYICPGIHNKDGFDLYSKGKNQIGNGSDIDDINNWD